MKIEEKIFKQDTLSIAKKLLGCYLCRKIGDVVLKGKITETEAYIGQDDRACHAACGMTERNKKMFGPPGHAYVYIIYGMHYCLNVVTEKQNFPAAVLIRGIEPFQGLEIMQKNRKKHDSKNLTNGPGKLCQALAIDKKMNGENLIKSNRLWLEINKKIAPKRIKTTPRIAVDYAGKDAKLPWRFLVV